MLLLKFNFVWLFFLFSLSSYAGPFTPKECLESSFETQFEYNAGFFGMVKKNFKLKKEQCLITIDYKRYLSEQWVIDACREPVHVKYDNQSGVKVYKRGTNSCSDKDPKPSEYCLKVDELIHIIQDDGLIFSKGDKEDLNSDHGKVYCAYQLMNRYLQYGHVYSRYALETEAPKPTQTSTIIEKK